MSNVDRPYKEYKNILSYSDFKNLSGDQTSSTKLKLKWVFHNLFLTIKNIFIFFLNKYKFLTYKGNRFTVVLFMLFVVLTSIYIFALTNVSIFKQLESDKTFVVINMFLFALLILVGYTILDGDNKDTISKLKYRDPELWKQNGLNLNEVNFSKNLKAFSKDYLFSLRNTIGLASILGVLMMIYFLISIVPATTNEKIVKNIVPLGIFIGVSFLLFIVLPKIPIFKKILSLPIPKLIFNLILFIPCLFFEMISYLYKQNLKTPKIVYKVLFVQIVFIVGYFVLPIINKLTYTTVKRNRDMTIVLETKILSSMDKSRKLSSELDDLLNHKNDYSTEDNIDPIPQTAWDRIVSKNWHISTDDTMKLRLNEYLTNYGYILPEKFNEVCYSDGVKKNTFDCNRDINKMVEYIHNHSSKYISLLSEIESEREIRSTAKKELNKMKKKQTFFENGKILLNKPIPLNERKNVIIPENLITNDNVHNAHYNYSVSMWLFIKSTPSNHVITNDGYVDIMSFDGQPKIEYNVKENKLRISMVKSKKPETKSISTPEPEDQVNIIYSVPLQRWNNIVVNYDGGTYDLYFNDQLIANYKNITPIVGVRNVYVGSDNGMRGGLCNLVYFPWHLSRERISANYDLFKNKRPPILGDAEIVSKIR